ncbi:autotransporter outer membrane beta-barrel domain-containing protein [Cognatiyoonia sp. IB215182]|uniref:autotransporter family protein n=1 Tax=Cognatiyoonia sp. IB215182 TaxID=3097353 RepID=UPI002A0BB255|nr:autotransporter outer membrane beta-barrel domain-containing protein [Cognatiyoonia sp. IB215182]MDX8355325.1 autotransporter outer membrane beta-barrel domain-containing protein [Cognatiyoonia sp. IB215182]
MTNQFSDTQPALRPFNVLVRGGRLTRFKGQVASIAPGLLVVATAAVLFTGSAAQAANECGADEVGQDAVTCDASDNTANGIDYGESDGVTLILDDPGMTVGGSGVKVEGAAGSEGEIFIHLKDGEVSTSGEAKRALWGATLGRGSVTVQMDGGRVVTAEVNAYALWAQINNSDSDEAARNEADAKAVMTGGEINTSKRHGHGLLVSHEGFGNAIGQVMDGGKIATSGGDAYGVKAEVKHAESTANATASMTDGEIHTGGIWSHGLYAINRGLGAATVQMDGGSITTSKLHARALYAEITNQNSEARATASATGDAKIKTVDRKAYGLLAKTDGLGDTLAAIDRSSITTLGREAHGLWAEITNTASTATSTAHMNESNINTIADDTYGLFAWTEGRFGGALAQMSGGRVTTLGEDAYGLLAYVHEAESEATATVRMTKGDVETIGEYSHALWADNRGRDNATVQLEGGTVTTAGKGAYGLLAGAYGGGSAVVDLGEDATVRVFGADADGIRAEGATGFDVDVAGHVTGGSGNGAAIRTISGAGGEIDIASGAIVTAGGSGIAIVDWNGDAVVTLEGTVTGDIRLGAGDDSLTISSTAIYDFSHILDGGAGDNDHLTLHDRTMTSMENVTGWEQLTLKDKTNLSLDGVARLDMNLSIDGTSAFRATGREGGLTIRGDVTNNDGSVVLSVQNGETGDEIRVEGNFTGSDTGSDVFALDMGRDADGLRTDTVVITGDTSGEMTLLIAGMDSADLEGAPLVMDVVSVGGEANGTFTLVGGNYVTSDGEHAMISGAHLYKLAETDQGLALSARSESGEVTYQPSAPVYDSYGASLLAFNAPSGLHARGSAQDFRALAWGGAGADAADQDTGSPLWIRMGTEQLTTSEEHSTTGAALESSLWEMEIGADLTLNSSDAGLLVGGLMFSYGTGSTDVSSDLGDGSIETSGLGLGLAATWYDARRFYVDGQVTLTSYTSDLTADRLGTLTEGNSGTGYALSLEAGQQLDLGTRLTVTPQSQLSLSSVTFSDFTSEAHQEAVALSDASSQQLRLGLEVAAQERGESGLYGIVNLYHEFGAGSEVEVAGTSLTTEREPWTLGAGLGGSYVLSERVDLFGDVAYATGLSNAGDTSALSANAGLKVVF